MQTNFTKGFFLQNYAPCSPLDHDAAQSFAVSGVHYCITFRNFKQKKLNGILLFTHVPII